MQMRTQSGESLRFGIVGAGRIAESYLAAFRSTHHACLTAVADVQPGAAHALAEKAGCLSFSSHHDLLLSGAIDAVVVATPPATHEGICVDFLQQHIPVLCEKPVSLSGESARLIRRTSVENKTPFTMASKFRYAADVLLARKKVVEDQILGDIVLFENTFMSYVDMSARWNANPALSGGGVLIDNGTHSIDIMRYFLGPLSSIHVLEGTKLQPLPVEDTVLATIRAQSGAVGRIDLSWSINKKSDHYIEIHGSKGTLRVGWKASHFLLNGASEWVQFGHGYDKVQAFRDQIDNFARALQGLDRLVIDAHDAVASVDVIQSGYQAMAQHKWVPIPPSQDAGMTNDFDFFSLSEPNLLAPVV
jgi:predicted dehydrogenase